MRRILVAGTLLLMSMASLAQPSWNGLQLGASQSETMHKLSDKGFSLNEIGQASPDYDLRLPPLALVFPFKPLLGFKGSKLSLITLELDVPKMQADDPKFSMVAVAALTPPAIREALIGKYGAPIESEGSCAKLEVEDLVPLGSNLSCTTTWRAENQLILLSALYTRVSEFEIRFQCFLQYKAQVESGL
jgi:hypothetical protein